VFSANAAEDERLAGSARGWRGRSAAPLRRHPLRLQDGTTVGTLCLSDSRRHTLTEVQHDLLLDIADEISSLLDLVSLSSELGHDAAHDAGPPGGPARPHRRR
jgi:hypothetical protein